jgi:hypothetical protein
MGLKGWMRGDVTKVSKETEVSFETFGFGCL